MPFSNSSSDNFHLPKKIHHPLSHDFRLLDTREMRRIFDKRESRPEPRGRAPDWVQYPSRRAQTSNPPVQ
jgi:hypothetical protein